MKAWTKVLHFLLVLQILRLVSARRSDILPEEETAVPDSRNVETPLLFSKLESFHTRIGPHGIPVTRHTCQQKLSLETPWREKSPKELFYALKVCGTVFSRPELCSRLNGTIEFSLKMKNKRTQKIATHDPIKMTYNPEKFEHCVVYQPLALKQLFEKFGGLNDNVLVSAETSIFGLKSQSAKAMYFENYILGYGAFIPEGDGNVLRIRTPFTGIFPTNFKGDCEKLLEKRTTFIRNNAQKNIFKNSASSLLGYENSGASSIIYYEERSTPVFNIYDVEVINESFRVGKERKGKDFNGNRLFPFSISTKNTNFITTRKDVNGNRLFPFSISTKNTNSITSLNSELEAKEREGKDFKENKSKPVSILTITKPLVNDASLERAYNGLVDKINNLSNDVKHEAKKAWSILGLFRK